MSRTHQGDVMVKQVHGERRNVELAVKPLYSGLVPDGGIPRYQLASGPMAPDSAAALVRDEIMLDSNARLNLATYCTTWMEPQAKQLIADSLDRNLIDHDQYAQTAELETRCVNILANLWNDPGTNGVGCSTSGSSEATMLAGLAMKFDWRARRRAQGLPADRPNLVMPSVVHTCWPKFCRYWDVEPRYVPIREPGFTVDPAEVASLCDENTIGAVAILGSSALGIYDPVAEMASALDRLQAERGVDVPLHVDAAVGGFIAPFLEPDLVWDFRVPRVLSINTSGHKFGLVYPGIGWIIWRDKKALPKELIFECELLGGSVPTFTLNFSRSGAPVVAQYYTFLRLGFEGYRAVQQACRDVASYLAEQLAKMPALEVISDGTHLPVVALRMRPDTTTTVFDIHDRMRKHGWQIPAYHLPDALDDVAVMRLVIRNGFSRDTADILLNALRAELAELFPTATAKADKPAIPTPRRRGPVYH
ncbi:glutamate decarboxylase [Actinoallomurus liliacearum]